MFWETQQFTHCFTPRWSKSQIVFHLVAYCACSRALVSWTTNPGKTLGHFKRSNRVHVGSHDRDSIIRLSRITESERSAKVNLKHTNITNMNISLEYLVKTQQLKGYISSLQTSFLSSWNDNSCSFTEYDTCIWYQKL